MTIQNNITTHEKLSQITRRIYDAALDVNEWSGVLENLATLFNAHGGVLRYINSNRNGQHFGEQHGYGKTYIEQYNAHYSRFDNFNTRLKGLEGKCLTIASEESSEWFSSCNPLYREFLNQYDVHNLLGANIMENAHGHFVLGMHRSSQAGKFSKQDVLLFEILSPHLKNAIKIQNRLHEHKQQSKAGYSAMDCLPFGVVFLDRNKRPIWHNRRATEIASTGAGLNITSDKVCCDRSAESQQLSRLIDDALRENRYQGGKMALSSEAGNLTIFVVPLGLEHHQYSALADQAQAVIFLGDSTSDSKVSTEILHMLYALTPAESRLVNGLCEGLTIKEMEEAFGLSGNTLRSQLKTIFRKTGTNRQAELVRRVMTGPAILRP